MMRRRRRPRYLAEERFIRQLTGQLSRTRSGRKVLLALMLVALLALCGWWVWHGYLRPRHPVGPTVRVATWNLRHFSDRETIDLNKIADIIRSSNFDVIAIQEVKQTGEQVDRLLNVLGSPWRSTRLSERTGNSERFVFLYHGDHVQAVGQASFISGRDIGVFDRTPYQCMFRAGQFDFNLISVHLSYTDAQRRAREAQTLARYATALAGSQDEKDIIVLGDFNEEYRGNLHVFEDQGWQVLNTTPTNLSSKRIYDTLIVELTATREWSGVAGAIRFDEIFFRGDDRLASEKVSDHRPAYADFVTNLPDDD